MKQYIIASSLLISALAFTSCEDFLDTVPDNRTDIDSEAKLTSLLVTAYPQAYPVVMYEMASDNTTDNGSLYDVESQSTEQAYLWQDITDTDTDCPQGIWDNCYSAIAASNHVLEAIETSFGESKTISAQKGEALITRAYAHFILANTFCVAYNPATAESQMGIPYATEPEKTVKPHYERGTLAETYRKIAEDIEAALPLIDDNLYKVSKYHFNKKAAYAFAARFYLFYVQPDKSNYEKVITYANQVLSSDPKQDIHKYWPEMGKFEDLANKADAYIDASSPANLLIIPVYSSWPYIYGPYNLNKRYGMSREITSYETLWADGPWGSSGNTTFEYMNGSDQKFCFFKYNMYFEYTDKVNGIGYRHAVLVPFTTNETLICRAEAHAMKAQPDYAKAVSDINSWTAAIDKKGLKKLTLDDIVKFYKEMESTPIIVETAKQRTVKRTLNPVLPFVDESQENLIHCILQMRRIEGIHDGLRWLDIKRYGIEYSHIREGLAPDQLLKDDPRRAIQLPFDVINAGLPANPR